MLGLDVCTGIMTARLLGPAGRGELAAILLWPQLLSFLLVLGLPSALLYNLKLRPEKSSALVGASLVMGTVAGIVAILIGMLLIPWWLEQYTVEIRHFAQLCMLAAPFALLGLICQAAMQARNTFTLFNGVRLMQSFGALILLVTFALMHTLNPFTAASSYLASSILAIGIWSLAWVFVRYRPTLRGFNDAKRYLFFYSLRSWGESSLNMLTKRSDRLMVVGFLEPAAMGMYVVALSFSEMLNIFSNSVHPVLFPKASGRTTSEVVALTGRAVRVTVAVTALMAAGAFLLGPYLLGLVYGEGFTAATSVLRLLVMETVLFSAMQILSQAFLASNRPGIATTTQGLGLGLVVLLLVLLVPRYGIEGAGMAILLATSARLVFVCACFPIVLKVSPPRPWIWPSEIAIAWREVVGRLQK